MPASLAHSASVSATSDFIGSPTGNFLIGAQLCDGASTEVEPATSVHALGSALRALGPADAALVLEALATQAAALSLVLAADAGGAIRLPDSLRGLVEAASVLPAFLGGAAN